jgi:hypothetical protein
MSVALRVVKVVVDRDYFLVALQLDMLVLWHTVQALQRSRRREDDRVLQNLGYRIARNLREDPKRIGHSTQP